MKKIIFFMPNIERGGIEKNLLLLSNYFINKNYQVKIVYSSISNEIKKKLNNRVELDKSGKYINFWFFSDRINNSINCFIKLIFFKEKKNSKSIMLSMQDHPFSIIASKKNGIKCILRIANHPRNSLIFFNNFINFKLKLFIKIFFYRFANGIICNSISSSKYLKSKIKNINIVSIYNPIKLNKNKEKIKKKNYLLTVGRLEKQKNIKGLIRAFSFIHKKYYNYILLIIGSGQEEKSLKHLVKKYNLNNQIKFIKFISPSKYYNSSKIFILNSFFEGQPNVLIEALKYKVPIISSDCESGPREILVNGKYGFLTPVNDSLSLSKKISYVLDNYKIAKNKSKLGNKSLKRFKIESQCLKYERYINNLF